jgi:hypothetical protein
MKKYGNEVMENAKGTLILIKRFSTPTLQYFITPSLQYSNTPLLQWVSN